MTKTMMSRAARGGFPWNDNDTEKYIGEAPGTAPEHASPLTRLRACVGFKGDPAMLSAETQNRYI